MSTDPLTTSSNLKRIAAKTSVNRTFLTIVASGSIIFILLYFIFSQKNDIEVPADKYFSVLKQQCPVLVCPSSPNETKKEHKIQPSSNGTKMEPKIQPRLNCSNENDNLLEKAYERKYIGGNWWAVGGIGNQIWRFASLYGLGRFTGRHPYFEARNPSQMDNLMEIATVFPMMHEIVQVKNPPDSIIKRYHFADDCCKFDDPKKLLGLPEKYIKIFGDYMQSYKFFHPFRDEIRKVFECGPTIKVNVTKFATELFKNDTSHKLCAHVRRGDFIKDLMLETKEDWTIPAIHFAFDFLQEKGHENISMVFIGNDHDFIKNLNLYDVSFSKIYSPEAKSRGEDMCFGINHCDSMVMTASGSTYGWWISYLMKPNSTIFYNSQITDHADFTKDVHDFDIFPEEWIMLTLNGSVTERETKWWHQRKNATRDLPSDKMEPWP